MRERRERALGCILGGALGDALGGPYEGRRPPFEVARDRCDLALSDDTQLTLATCEALAGAERVDPAAIAARMLGCAREKATAHESPSPCGEARRWRRSRRRAPAARPRTPRRPRRAAERAAPRDAGV